MNPTLQIVSVLVTITFEIVIIKMVRKGTLRVKYSFLWILIGAIILAYALIPTLLESTAKLVGIFYPPALLFVGAIMLLLFIAVHFSWELSRIEERTRTLTEELGLAVTRIQELEDELQKSGSKEPAEKR